MATADSLAPADGDALKKLNALLHWRLLKLLNFFRLTVSLLLFLIFWTGWFPGTLGHHEPGLFSWALLVYASIALLSIYTLARQQPPLGVQTYFQFGADIVIVLLALHASGGIASGLGSLLFVTLAAASFVLRLRMVLLLAALASFGLLGEQFLSMVEGLSAPGAFTQAGLLGSILFLTAGVGNWLARRVQQSEALAIRRGVDLQNISQLNDYIVEHLQTGVVVVDDRGLLQQMNAAAAEYLGLSGDERGRPIREVAPAIANLYGQWLRAPHRAQAPFTTADGDGVIVPHVYRLGGQRSGGLLVLMERPDMAAERVQQTKLAALGRLTASIAHEVRNPLAAISHANQLLGESERLNAEDRRLVGIVSQQTGRVNAIVEDILQLSRRESTDPERLDLGSWLKDFVTEFAQTRNIAESAIDVDMTDGDLAIRIDPGHLHQVLSNLGDNAIRHAQIGDSDKRLTLRTGQVAPGRQTFLDVSDNGPGISADVAESIFEPFYTDSEHGTGLGLFIARELCECNGATLSWRRSESGACFRITFAAPDRWVT